MCSRSEGLINNNNIKANDEVIDENESIESINDYKRDSFDDRVCDDLSEVLLSYLSFEDKFGFECISKQWKSLVFNKHKKFSFNTKTFDSIVRKGKLNSKLFEEIFIKFKRIDSIDIDCAFNIFFLNIRNKSLILQLITKHCNDLKSIRYDFSGIDIKTIESFGHKFGNSLQVLENSKPESIQQMKPLFSFCNKLVSIKGINFEDLFDRNGKLLLITDRIESIGINIGFHDIKQFENFIDKYKHKISVISIRFDIIAFIDQYLIQMLKIINLKELNIKMHKNIVNNIISKSLSSILKNCIQLEKFSFNDNRYNSFYGNTSNNSNSLPFKLITQLKQLKYLSIDSNLFTDENAEQLSVKLFKDFRNLFHLTVENVKRGDDFFIDIDKYLPQLRALTVTNSESVLTELTFNHLSKLINIEKLEINQYLNFNLKAFEDLINNCKQIKSIKLCDDRNKQCFTNETIDGLISLAVKRPQIQFRFQFEVSEDIDSYWKQLSNKPNNIGLMFFVFYPLWYYLEPYDPYD